jgi:hypothetical protein
MVLADGSAVPAIVAADLITQAEHGPDSPALLVTTDPALADAVEAEVARQLGDQPRRAIVERSLAELGRIVLAPTLEAAIEFVNAYAPEHLSVEDADLEPTVARLRNAGSLFVGRWAPSRPATMRQGRSRAADRRPRARGSAPSTWARSAGFIQVSASTALARRPARRSGASPCEGCSRTGRGRDPIQPRRGGTMSPTPVTFSSPTSPAGYAWEATSEQVAARYGLPVEAIVRFDLNTSPTPPDLVGRVLAAGRFETPLSEYPPSDYRRLVEAAGARYGVSPDELLVGAGADEVLDLVAKAFLPAGGVAVVPTRPAMYRVLTERRPRAW